MKRGTFISFEGGEGSGKSTQIRFVASYFRRKRRKVLVVREPGSTRLGESVRKILLNVRNRNMSVETELFFYLAARAQLVREGIGPALRQGYVVISDRFEDSTLVYQGYAGGLGLARLATMVREARGNVVPSMTFLLDVEPRKGLLRCGRRDRMERKSILFHERIRKGYLLLARRYSKRFVVISSRLSKSEVRSAIRRTLDRVYSRSR